MPRVHQLISTLAMAALSACGNGEGSGITPPVNRPPNSISIVSGAETRGTAAFDPNPLSVSLASGGVVTWRNDDRQAAEGEYGGTNGTIHNIGADDLSYFSGNITPGGTYQHTFDAAGTYEYHCNIHPAMRGTITVTP